MDEQALDKNKQQLGTYRVILEPEGRASVNSQLSKKLVPFSDEWSAPPCSPPPKVLVVSQRPSQSECFLLLVLELASLG